MLKMALLSFGFFVLIGSAAIADTAKPKKIIKKPAVSTNVKQIVREAEKVRSTEQSRTKVRLTTYSKDSKKEYTMTVLQGKERKVYVDFDAPEKGRQMLAIKTTYFARFPGSSKVVNVSRAEAVGDSAFALGDIYQMDIEREYEPELKGSTDYNGEDCHLVQLTAKISEAAYSRIDYTIRKKDNYPLMAKFYGASNSLLKTLTVINSKLLMGRIRPSEVKMVDNTVADKYSIWVSLNAKSEKIPETIFTQAYLQSR